MFNVLGASEITANLYCNCGYLYWEGWGIIAVYICDNIWIHGTPSLYEKQRICPKKQFIDDIKAVKKIL